MAATCDSGVRVRTAAHPDYGDVWGEVRKLSWQWLVVLGLATLLKLRNGSILRYLRWR